MKILGAGEPYVCVISLVLRDWLDCVLLLSDTLITHHNKDGVEELRPTAFEFVFAEISRVDPFFLSHTLTNPAAR